MPFRPEHPELLEQLAETDDGWVHTICGELLETDRNPHGQHNMPAAYDALVLNHTCPGPVEQQPKRKAARAGLSDADVERVAQRAAALLAERLRPPA